MAANRENFTVGIPLLLDIAHFMELQGVRYMPLSEWLRLPPAMLNDPDGRAPFAVFSTVWAHVVKNMHHYKIPVLFGSRWERETDGLGQILAAGSSAFQFMQRYCQHLSLVNPAVHIVCRLIDDEIELRITPPEIWSTAQPKEAGLWALAILMDLHQHVKVLYPALKPVLVRTVVPAGPVTEAFSEVVGRTVLPDPSSHSIRFSKKEALMSVCSIDPTASLLDSPGEREWALLKNRPENFGLLRNQLQKLPELEVAEKDMVLEAFTLLTRSALRSTFLATLELTVLFGFTNHQQFSRVFKARQGSLPREWRKRYNKSVRSDNG